MEGRGFGVTPGQWKGQTDGAELGHWKRGQPSSPLTAFGLFGIFGLFFFFCPIQLVSIKSLFGTHRKHLS